MDNDLPKPGTVADDALSFDEGVAGLSDLLGPNADPDEDANEAEGEVDDTETEEVEVEADEADAEEGEEDAEEEDDSSDVAPDDLMVTAPDGSQVTVAQLREWADKRARDFQRDYTRKSEAVKARETTVETAAQTLAQERDFLVRLTQAYMPQEPNPELLQTDPISYLQAKEAYDRGMRTWQQLRHGQQQEMQRQQAMLAEQQKQVLAEQQQVLVERMPELKDPVRFESFAKEAIAFGTDTYGFTPEEVGAVTDARYLSVLADAIKWRKAKANAPVAQKAMQGKPKPMRSGKRESLDAKASNVKRKAEETLRKTGAFDAGVAALMNLDL